jgi:hypothetical protein
MFSGVSVVSVSPGCSESAGVVTCSVPELARGAETTFTVVVQVDVPSARTILNTAAITSGQLNPVASNNSASENTGVQASVLVPGLSVWALAGLAALLVIATALRVAENGG